MVGMEAAAVKAAVSGTLNLLCNKLAPLVIKEYSSIVGVKEDLRELQDLAQVINSWLEAAGDRAMGDDPWLKKLKEAAYDVDDVVDEFQLKAEKFEADVDAGFVSKYLHTKPKSFIFQCKAAKKIKKIKKTFDDIVKKKTVLNSMVGHDVASRVQDRVVERQTLATVDKTEVIGRDQQMNDIISELLQDDDQQRIKTVSIVGLGGSGKTTLAQLVFSEVKDKSHNHFPVKIWVHVSEEKFQLEKILKKLFDAISDERSDGLSLRYMANKISGELTNKKFLLVLDDVWTEDRIKWAEFMVHLKKCSPGSRILLTTRSRNVAEAVESTVLIDLPLLSKDYSWKVFQQSYGNVVEHDFEEVGKEIVNKCGGVPLAIKVLAGVLHDKKRVEQWQAIRDHNLFDVNDKEHRVSNCLWLSYFNLESHLKPCFTICSIFPKGHWMDKDQLIDQWIAHDMVTEDGRTCLEHIGDQYFSHLVQIFFIEDVMQTFDGSVKCKMHDLVHDLATSILGDAISPADLTKAINSTKMYRYFSILEHTRHRPPKNTFQKARAMYINEGDDFIFGKASKNAKHLRSITAEYVHTSAVRAILQTKNLRYLNISWLKCKTLPEVISDIWCLQALHVTSSDLVKLPESIGNLQKLSVVNLSHSWRLTGLPDSIGNCVMISTIDLFDCMKVTTLPSSISRNKRLRVLRLGFSKLQKLPSSITTLEKLECLDLFSCSELVELPEDIGNLKKLVVLNLDGCTQLRGIPKGIGKLTGLEKLGLFVTGEDKNYAEISELENVNKICGELTINGIAHCMDLDVAHKEWLKHKTNLQSLTLICASDVGVNSGYQLEGLEPPSGIKEIKIVRYSGQESRQWMFRFHLLTKLELSGFPKLECLEGLTELPCLVKLVLKEMTALKSISGGPFPLLELFIDEMPSLGEVHILTKGSLADVEGGQLQIGIHECPKLMVMAYFPWPMKELVLSKSNVQLLELPSVEQRSSLPSSSAGLPCFSFICLKNLYLFEMPPPAKAGSCGSGCRWELLQHLTALESLSIVKCDGLTELPESMRSLASLRTLSIWYCSALCLLPEWLGELRYLEMMDISQCGSLSPAPSMQPLTALKQLTIADSGWVGDLCSPSLQELTINDCDGIHNLPQSFRQLTSLTILRILNCRDFPSLSECLLPCSLQKLYIKKLQNLSSLPQSLVYLTSLKELEIRQCDALYQLPECVGNLCSLHVFNIWELPSLMCLPQSLGRLTSLQELEIKECDALGQLPDGVGDLCSLHVFKICRLPSLTCLPQSLGRLTSLQELEIGSCKALGQLPESLGELHSLRKFEIWGLPGLTSIPEWMCKLTSLEQLRISGCPGIKSLPKWIKGLTALQTLRIYGCPDLEKRCERRKGKDWHLISHIPHLWIGEMDVRYRFNRYSRSIGASVS